MSFYSNFRSACRGGDITVEENDDSEGDKAHSFVALSSQLA